METPDILKNVPEQYINNFKKALIDAGFENTLLETKIEFGSPVLLFKLGYIMALENMLG